MKGWATRPVWRAWRSGKNLRKWTSMFVGLGRLAPRIICWSLYALRRTEGGRRPPSNTTLVQVDLSTTSSQVAVASSVIDRQKTLRCLKPRNPLEELKHAVTQRSAPIEHGPEVKLTRFQSHDLARKTGNFGV